MKKIKAIVLDIDGTLYNSKKEVTPKTKDILIQAQQQGIKVILASGRPTSGMLKVGKELHMDTHDSYYISFNGAKVVSAKTQEEVFDYPMMQQDIKAVLHHLKKFKGVRVMIDKDDYMYVHDVYDNFITFQNKPFNVFEYEARGGNYKLCEVDDLEEFVDFSVNKILTTGEPEYLLQHYEEMAKPFVNHLNCMFTGPFYYEFTAQGIDKAKALAVLFNSMDIKREEIISFGDGHNDASILQYAGIGVAMGNAVDELKKIADHITLSNDEDGIAVALMKYIPTLIGR